MRRFALLLVPLLLVACDREPVAPDLAPSFGGVGATVTHGRISGSFGLCGLDVVDYEGVRHWSRRLVIGDENHMSHWQETVSAHFVLTGRTTGYVWRWNDAITRQSQWDDNDGAPDEYTSWNRVIHVIGYDGAPSFDLRSHVRYTVNANGDLVQEFDRFEPLCN